MEKEKKESIERKREKGEVIVNLISSFRLILIFCFRLVSLFPIFHVFLRLKMEKKKKKRQEKEGKKIRKEKKEVIEGLTFECYFVFVLAFRLIKALYCFSFHHPNEWTEVLHE